MAREIPMKIKVSAEGSHFVNTSDNFMQVKLLTSVTIPNVRSNYFIDTTPCA